VVSYMSSPIVTHRSIPGRRDLRSRLMLMLHNILFATRSVSFWLSFRQRIGSPGFPGSMPTDLCLPSWSLSYGMPAKPPTLLDYHPVIRQPYQLAHPGVSSFVRLPRTARSLECYLTLLARRLPFVLPMRSPLFSGVFLYSGTLSPPHPQTRHNWPCHIWTRLQNHESFIFVSHVRTSPPTQL
jgi:hypothetical protein